MGLFIVVCHMIGKRLPYCILCVTPLTLDYMAHRRVHDQLNDSKVTRSWLQKKPPHLMLGRLYEFVLICCVWYHFKIKSTKIKTTHQKILIYSAVQKCIKCKIRDWKRPDSLMVHIMHDLKGGVMM